MKKLLILALFSSCAHDVVTEKYSSNLDEVKKDDVSFYVLKEYKPKFRSRSISSVESDSSISNKELYFTTLFHQYKKLTSLTKSKNEIKSCPAFHQIWIGFNKEGHSQEMSLPYSYKEIVKKEYSLASFPELGLETSSGKKVIEYVSSAKNQKQTVKNAINSYNENNYNELVELCDTGVSSNYYVFENMISYYSKQKDFHQSGKALNAFMKMPIVTNSVLIDRFSSETDFYNEVGLRNQALARLGANWFENYLYDLKNIRQNLSNITYNKAMD